MKRAKTAVALGIFDGVHLGHQAVLKLAAEQLKNGLAPCAVTFSPGIVSLKKCGSGFIFGESEKMRLLKKYGISNIRSFEFNDIRDMDGEKFAGKILAEEMNASFVCCGNDFRFGKNAACGVRELRKFGEKFGFSVCAAADVSYDGETVSSTKIRRALLNGDVSAAGSLLGRSYSVAGQVVHGARLGRTIGFPTVNQLFEKGQLVPKYGVYASQVVIDGKLYGAMTDIGVKPTVDYGGCPLAETNIFDFRGDLYGTEIVTEILDFIRPEMKFGSVEELTKQLRSDEKKIRGIT
mgnify:CR=1 FL=1